MMLPFVHKLWDKGVDIAAGIIAGAFTAAIVAIIGLLFWKIKLWLDFRAEKAKFLQQKELERQDAQRREATRRAALLQNREQFAWVAVRTLDRKGQAELWNQVCDWMKKEGLLGIQTNLVTYTDRAGLSQKLRDASWDINVERNAHILADTIRNIELPLMDIS